MRNSTHRPTKSVAIFPERSRELLPVIKIEQFKVARKEAKTFSKLRTC